jgi:hypothetical protein
MVDWSRLTHAYGKATDLPLVLDERGASSAAKRSRALARIGASICHQGTLYTATAPAAVALVEGVASAKPKDRAAILRLLGAIATLDGTVDFLIDGKVRARRPPAWKRALGAVAAGGPLYRALLEDGDRAVRARAAYLLASLPTEPKGAARAILEALARETSASATAALLLALGSLGRALRSSATVEPRESRLTHRDAHVRAAAAIACAQVTAGRPGERATAELAKAARTKRLVVEELGWSDGDLAALATRTLAALPRTDVTDDALIGVVEAGASGAPFAANVLVRRLFVKRKRVARRGQPKEPRRDRRDASLLAAVALTPESLDDRQRAFSRALRRHADAGPFDADLVAALEERGLPGDSTLFARWVDGAPPPASILDREARIGGARRTVGDALVEAVKASSTRSRPRRSSSWRWRPSPRSR